MDREKDDNQLKPNPFKFSKIALVVGFIADSIALISILLALNLPNNSIKLPNFINPWFAISIWAIAVYTYLSYLHFYWRKNLSSDQLSNNFNAFLGRDLFLKFRKPLLLFPALVFLIIFIWIVVFIPIILLIPVFFIFFVSIFFSITAETEADRRNKKWRKVIENVDKLIASRFPQFQWIGFEDLTEISKVFNLSSNQISYILALYALKYPDTAKYGKVYRKKDNVVVSGEYNVLINLKQIDCKKYYWG